MINNPQLGMQLSFEQLHQKYDPIKKITGIIHIGACTGEEREVYKACGVTRVKWFEANPDLHLDLLYNLQQYTFNEVYSVLLSNTDDEIVNFYVTKNKFNGRAASSSMLDLDKHRQHHPDVIIDKIIQLKTHRFDTLVKKMPWIVERCNFLNMDVQGAELKVLEGIGDYINNFDYIYSEINVASLYKNCVQLPELEEYLNARGFIRQETNMTPYEWGDAIFIRNELIQ